MSKPKTRYFILDEEHTARYEELCTKADAIRDKRSDEFEKRGVSEYRVVDNGRLIWGVQFKEGVERPKHMVFAQSSPSNRYNPPFFKPSQAKGKHTEWTDLFKDLQVKHPGVDLPSQMKLPWGVLQGSYLCHTTIAQIGEACIARIPYEEGQPDTYPGLLNQIKEWEYIKMKEEAEEKEATK